MFSTKLFFKRSLKTLAAPLRKLKRVPNDSLLIFAYHRVVADLAKAENESIYGLVISTETFREHCRMLRENFDIISIEEAEKFLEGNFSSKRPKAVITFDDGYLDNYEEAFPVLRQMNLPATIFLPTQMIGQSEPLAHDKAFWLVKKGFEKKISIQNCFINAGINGDLTREINKDGDMLSVTDKIVYLPATQRDAVIAELEKNLSIKNYPKEYDLLDWEMVREMSRNQISFGVHSASHTVLTLENETEFEREINESKKTLEEKLGREIISFAYPNGKFNGKVRRHVVKSGYKLAVSTETHANRRGGDSFTLGRISFCEESTRGIGGKFSRPVAEMRLSISI